MRFIDYHKVLGWKYGNELTAVSHRTIGGVIGVNAEDALLSHPPHITIPHAGCRIGICRGTLLNPVTGDHLFIQPSPVSQEKQAKSGHIPGSEIEKIGREKRFFTILI